MLIQSVTHAVQAQMLAGPLFHQSMDDNKPGGVFTTVPRSQIFPGVMPFFFPDYVSIGLEGSSLEVTLGRLTLPVGGGARIIVDRYGEVFTASVVGASGSCRN